MSKVPIIKEFEVDGLHCIIRKNTTLFPGANIYLGYVSVPKENPYYGISYSKLEDKPLFNCVHGGLTYSDKDGENWVFGFDYAHAEDMLNPPTLEDVEKSCKLLAKALNS